MFGISLFRKRPVVSFSVTRPGTIRLYHGSNVCVNHPEMGHNNEWKTRDFGDGFYLTPSQYAAKSWARGKDHTTVGKVTIFVFRLADAEKDGVITRFQNPDLDWADFVIRNRIGVHTEHKPIVVGPIADNTMEILINRYLEGRMSFSSFCNNLKPYRTRFGEIAEQYAFTNSDCLKYLDRIDCFEVR